MNVYKHSGVMLVFMAVSVVVAFAQELNDCEESLFFLKTVFMEMILDEKKGLKQVTDLYHLQESRIKHLEKTVAKLVVELLYVQKRKTNG
ncbi:hypothetical protein DPMN_108518 [Dreissena polymorpha]|uniref:Uncharacterized protein n=1 Tax=Dreissena polymorpha TaxID=45954 RepID=A0A9D4QL26_DREPO|nr:hypothetical protein DPMN_108518 [Dreissena polymorpha]